MSGLFSKQYIKLLSAILLAVMTLVNIPLSSAAGCPMEATPKPQMAKCCMSGPGLRVQASDCCRMTSSRRAPYQHDPGQTQECQLKELKQLEHQASVNNVPHIVNTGTRANRAFLKTFLPPPGQHKIFELISSYLI